MAGWDVCTGMMTDGLEQKVREGSVVALVWMGVLAGMTWIRTSPAEPLCISPWKGEGKVGGSPSLRKGRFLLRRWIPGYWSSGSGDASAVASSAIAVKVATTSSEIAVMVARAASLTAVAVAMACWLVIPSMRVTSK